MHPSQLSDGIYFFHNQVFTETIPKEEDEEKVTPSYLQIMLYFGFRSYHPTSPYECAVAQLGRTYHNNGFQPVYANPRPSCASV